VNRPVPLEQIEGQPIPGGCEDCGAHQTITETTPGVFVLTVHHDLSCPAYLARETER
jgi:hypothetical protein